MGRGKGKKKSSNEEEQTHKNAKPLGKGVRIRSQTKIVVENVRKFFENEKSKGHGKSVNVLKRTANNDYDIIYTDETWVNSHHMNEYIWLDADGNGGWKIPSGKGTRLIVVHAGGAEGWVDGADLVFLSKTKSADYHDEMNSEHYMEWLEEQLLPRLENPSVIVIDNASYHNKQVDKAPTTKDLKADIAQWLDDHKVPYSPTDLKRDLLDKVKQYRPSPSYLSGDIIHTAGHTVLRLPVAHCEFNPIELAWASVKGYVAKHNKDFTMTETKQLTQDGFVHTTKDMWRAFCRHVVDVENEYFENDGVVEKMVDDIVIDMGDDSDDDEEEEDLIDDDDWPLLDRALGQGPSTDGETPSTSAADNIMTNPRRDLTAQFQHQYDQQFLDDVLPLP